MEASPALLSVIIPVKDDFQGLKASWQALSDLTSVVEVVVVDGTDQNGQAIRHQFAEEAQPWHQLVVGAQSGVYPAMNQGVQAASGTFVLFCGAGDCVRQEVLAGWLRSQVATTAAADPRLHAFAVDMGGDREGGVPAVRRPQWTGRLNWQNTMHHQGLLIPRQWLLAEPFESKYRVLADYHWALKMHRLRKPVTVHQETLTECAGGGLSRQFTQALYREEWALKRSILPVWMMVAHVVWLPAKWAYKQLLNPAS
jgi:hypothetical protein